MHIGGRTLARLTEGQKGAEYHEFTPPRRPEEYVGQSGPHNGLALTYDVLKAIGLARVSHQSHGYLVRGEWLSRDGTRYLDIAMDVAWVAANSNYQLVNGFLRWVCPSCGRMSGAHNKGCDQR